MDKIQDPVAAETAQITQTQAVDLPRLVVLIKCGRKSCSHVLIEEERDWKPTKYGETAICPKCGEDAFYHLNEKGQELSWANRDEYRDGLDPALIEPSPRMGLKMKRRILRAKRHALSLHNDRTLAIQPAKEDSDSK